MVCCIQCEVLFTANTTKGNILTGLFRVIHACVILKAKFHSSAGHSWVTRVELEPLCRVSGGSEQVASDPLNLEMTEVII